MCKGREAQNFYTKSWECKYVRSNHVIKLSLFISVECKIFVRVSFSSAGKFKLPRLPVRGKASKHRKNGKPFLRHEKLLIRKRKLENENNFFRCPRSFIQEPNWVLSLVRFGWKLKTWKAHKSSEAKSSKVSVKSSRVSTNFPRKSLLKVLFFLSAKRKCGEGKKKEMKKRKSWRSKLFYFSYFFRLTGNWKRII